MGITDTSEAARRVYFDALAKLSPSERVRMGAGLWEAAGSLQRASLRRRYPEADEAEINFRIAETRFGPELARAAWRKV